MESKGGEKRRGKRRVKNKGGEKRRKDKERKIGKDEGE